MRVFPVALLLAIAAGCDNSGKIKAGLDTAASDLKRSGFVDSVNAKGGRFADSVKSKGGVFFDSSKTKGGRLLNKARQEFKKLSKKADAPK